MVDEDTQGRRQMRRHKRPITYTLVYIKTSTHMYSSTSIESHASVRTASEIPAMQSVTHTSSSTNSVPCSDGYTLCWMSCTELYRDERWGRPPHANIDEPLTSMAMSVCVCVCVYTCWWVRANTASGASLLPGSGCVSIRDILSQMSSILLHICFYVFIAHLYICMVV